MALGYDPSLGDPLPEVCSWYGLIELSVSTDKDILEVILQESVAEASAQGIIDHAVITTCKTQSEKFWAIRKAVVIAQRYAGASLKNDIAVPVSSVATFIDRALDAVVFLSGWDKHQAMINDIVLSLGGTISAEHGIGRIKKHEMVRMKDPVELDLMHKVKRVLDPYQIMNPGKVLSQRASD